MEVLQFGKHKGMPLQHVAEQDPQYVEWLLRQEPVTLPVERLGRMLAETRLARLADQYDRIQAKYEALKRHHKEMAELGPCGQDRDLSQVRIRTLEGVIATMEARHASSIATHAAVEQKFVQLRKAYAELLMKESKSITATL